MKVRDILTKHQLFSQLSEKTIAFLEKEAKIITFEPKEVLIPPGRKGNYFGIVIEGQLEALDMKEERLGLINKGEYLGEMSLLTGEPSTVGVRSVTPSQVLLVPHNVMARILPESPQMIKQLSSTMRVRLVKREDSVEEQEALHIARGSLPGPGDLLSSLGRAKKILVINCGYNSLKWNFFDTASPSAILNGKIDCIGEQGTVHVISTGPSGTIKIEKALAEADHAAALKDILEFLCGPKGPLNTVKDINAVGHRVEHGGERFSAPVVVDDNVISEIKALSIFSPQQNPFNLIGIEVAREMLPHIPQVAVFDTAFHHSIPSYAYLYGIPQQYYKEKGIRRYGFHGTSHQYAAMEASAVIKKPIDSLKIITCHLGHTASICAIDHGRSIDTSMGLTNLEGLVMATGAGDIDPGILIHLARQHGYTLEEVETLLSKDGGLLGLSGLADNMVDLREAAAKGNQDALTAIQVFCYRIKKYIGAYIAALDGLDLLVFTGGIGAGSSGVRARVCQGLFRLGVILDEIKNRSIDSPETVEDISDASATVKVLVVPPGEEKMIARETLRALKQKEASEIIAMPTNSQKEIPIIVSYRHVHLTAEIRDILFGKNHRLTPDERLSLSGSLVYKERVTLVGPRGKVENVRVQGPLRTVAQVEISRTEEFLLGIDAPVREAGNLSGTPGITIEGPKGRVALKQGVINMQRHIQLDPEDALLFGLRDGDRVLFNVEGERSLIFSDVLIMISPNHLLEMHIDADDAKAADIQTGMTGRITGIVGRRE